MPLTIPVGISNRHFHISQADLEILFGTGYQLSKLRDISQKGQFAANETLTVVGPKGKIEKIRIVGPTRGKTQLEISRSDAILLGLDPPVRYSGDLEGSASVRLIGPKGELDLKEGVIIAQRHIHMSPADAKKFGVKDRDRVIVAPIGQVFPPNSEDRTVIFDNVLIRVHESFVLDFHIDTDEANAAGLKTGDEVRILGFSSCQVAKSAKKLITENDVRRAILEKRRIKVPAGAKITPAAAELAKTHNVFI
ncbi:MAG: phosphate propanoyltransferase [candidate division KSB1 bacterium]|nr:phosphate propanoyltransferase [candidate division KSB1 bacterium]MDZ7302900.1 phosphate propanoyltransferase [candidate division KSB1 bacterium]MDZ7310475.1 phosphate propanoyltransferase [candidate division KSB1 bacterium]